MRSTRRPSFDLDQHELDALELSMIHSRRRDWLYAAFDVATLAAIVIGLAVVSQVI